MKNALPLELVELLESLLDIIDATPTQDFRNVLNHNRGYYIDQLEREDDTAAQERKHSRMQAGCTSMG